MPSPQSPGTTPSAYPKEHSTYHTGRASPATTWHGSHRPADASDPAIASYYMSPTSNASYPPPPPVNPSPPSGRGRLLPAACARLADGHRASTAGCGRRARPRASARRVASLRRLSLAPGRSWRGTWRCIARRAVRSSRARMSERPSAWSCPTGTMQGYVRGHQYQPDERPRLRRAAASGHASRVHEQEQASGGRGVPIRIAPTVKNACSRNNAPVANSLGAWGRATSLTGAASRG